MSHSSCDNDLLGRMLYSSKKRRMEYMKPTLNDVFPQNGDIMVAIGA